VEQGIPSEGRFLTSFGMTRAKERAERYGAAEWSEPLGLRPRSGKSFPGFGFRSGFALQRLGGTALAKDDAYAFAPTLVDADQRPANAGVKVVQERVSRRMNVQ